MSRPRVLLADDHRVVSEGLSRILAEDFELVGTVEDGRALVSAAKTLRPDVIVADISMPRLNGIEALIELRKERPDLKFIFLTMHQEPAYARRALEAGASGYVVKHSAATELVMAVHAALKGHTFIAPSLAREILQHPSEPADAASKLTPRQREILQLLAEGHSAKEIGAVLAISARTVEFHKYQIMDTFTIRSNAELIHFAIKHGIVTI
jgi:DNA-binding NarL/FixJ family response regulator